MVRALKSAIKASIDDSAPRVYRSYSLALALESILEGDGKLLGRSGTMVSCPAADLAEIIAEFARDDADHIARQLKTRAGWGGHE